jgi:hypothetical protein
MIYVRIDVLPEKGIVENQKYGGALVNCWILQDDIAVAVSIAKRMISEQGWRSQLIEEARHCNREDFPEESKVYFDQALEDNEVLVFHTYPTKQNG